jgi:hypothetical protein
LGWQQGSGHLVSAVYGYYKGSSQTIEGVPIKKVENFFIVAELLLNHG